MTEKILIDSGSSGRGWSYFGEWNLCPTKWARRHRPLGGGVIVPAADREEIDQELVALPLRKGSVTHTIQAHHYQSQLPDADRYYSVKEAFQIASDKYKLNASDASDIWAVYKAYLQHYKYDPWTPIAVEKLFKMSFDGVPYTMRVDLILEEKGKVHFSDHKTSSRVADSSYLKYALSGQFVAGELIGSKLYGTRWGGMVVNFLPSHARGEITDSFKRVRMPPIPGMSGSVFKRQIIRIASEIKYHDDHKTPLLEYPRAMHESICVTAYGPCENYDACRWDLPIPEVEHESNNDL